MNVTFSSKRVEKLCLDHRHCLKKIGKSETKKLYQHLEKLDFADNLADAEPFPGDLHHYRHGSPIFTLDLSKGRRLYFVACNDNVQYRKDKVTVVRDTVTEIKILEISNHYKPST